ADAEYVLLCRAQRCFRARLTPKPWRIGERFFEVGPLQAVTRKQLERDLKKAAPFASARFAAEVGQSHTVHPG
ncbi:MAG: putative transrane protein, partial [Chthoniobacter sp.]|nr:putative transrane protein [Chthoniobacter sp.]